MFYNLTSKACTTYISDKVGNVDRNLHGLLDLCNGKSCFVHNLGNTLVKIDIKNA